MKPKRKRSKRRILTFKKKVDQVQVCKSGPEKVFILPNGMFQENCSAWRQDNRNYLRKIKTQKS